LKVQESESDGKLCLKGMIKSNINESRQNSIYFTLTDSHSHKLQNSSNKQAVQPSN